MYILYCILYINSTETQWHEIMSIALNALNASKPFEIAWVGAEGEMIS